MTTEKEQLENQLMLMGLNGIAYTPYWNEVAKRLEEIEKGEKK